MLLLPKVHLQQQLQGPVSKQSARVTRQVMGLPAAQQWKEFQSGIGTAEQEVRHRAQWAHTPGSREGMVVGKQFRTAGAGWRLKGCNKILSPHIPYWQWERSNSSRKQPKSKRADSREKQHPQSHRTNNDCGFFSFGHDKNYDKTANMSKQIYRGKKCQTSKSHNLEEITAYYSLLEGSSAVVMKSPIMKSPCHPQRGGRAPVSMLLLPADTEEFLKSLYSAGHQMEQHTTH